MQDITLIKEKLQSGSLDEKIKEIYVDEKKVSYNRERYIKLLETFSQIFPNDVQAEIYSAPGRSEVCGNHTDHQGGVVLAASINIDAIAAAAPSPDNVIRLVSDDYPMEIVDLSKLEMKPEEKNTTKAIIRGVLAGLKNEGYAIGGFNAFVTSDVLVGAGMSSSAAFESLIGTIISGLYNNMSISPKDIAGIGQYAENIYFGKPCGLMDQMACSVGGMVYIDFEKDGQSLVEAVESDFEKAGISLCIVDTKGSHADLTADYAAIPEEMGKIAGFFGKKNLRQVSEEEFYSKIPQLRKEASDRAVVRAVHFYGEEKRVERIVETLRESDYEGFLEIINESGSSSARYLQNIYSPQNPLCQNVNVALAVSDSILYKRGACRVHGGGFAGTIQAFVKNDLTDVYRERLEEIFGSGSCHVMRVRQFGGIRVV